MNSNLSNMNYSSALGICQMMLKIRAASDGRYLKPGTILEVIN